MTLARIHNIMHMPLCTCLYAYLYITITVVTWAYILNKNTLSFVVDAGTE